MIEQTTTGTRRRRVPEEVKEQVRRYAERRRAQGSSLEAIGRETGLEARKLRAWYRKAREATPVPALRPVAVVAEPDQICPSCDGDLKPMQGQFEEADEIDVVERSYQ